MKTGFCGTFVIGWSQTEIDGLDAPPLDALRVGAAWQWRGDTVRVDGPNDVLQLDRSESADALRRRAARQVRRLVGAALAGKAAAVAKQQQDIDDQLPLMDNSFVITDGGKTYTVTVVEAGKGRPPLLMFLDEIPPSDREFWVVHHTLERVHATASGEGANASGGVICFTPGTRISTPEGRMRIEDLREGDLVQTKDNGAQPIQWIGQRRMTGARLLAMPHLRPVRIRADFFANGRPDADLLVSPEHRVLVEGAAAQALFNTPEVLVRAQDLLNGDTVAVDHALREVTYVHLLLDHHEVLFANGVETESFHPASAALGALDEVDRSRLLAMQPELELDPHSYGRFARRSLTTSEAAILQHAA